MSTVIFWLSIFWFSALSPKANCLIKLTNVKCINLDETLFRVNECRLRAVKRDLTVFNANLTLLQPINDFVVNVAIFKRYNGYKPFLINITANGCEYLERKNHPVGNLILKLLKDNTNINHSCPYEGDVLLKNFYFPQEKFGLSIPDGDYKGQYNSWIGDRKVFEFNMFATVTEN